MNTPARFENLLWMASPMLAWAQTGAEAPAKPATPKRAATPRTTPQSARKRSK